MGRHGNGVAEIDIIGSQEIREKTFFDTMSTPKKSLVRPEMFGKYITSCREAAQERWRRRIGQRARSFVRKHPPLARFLKAARSKLHNISK